VTKLNWEKASQIDRHFRWVFRQDRPADSSLEFDQMPASRRFAGIPNPLGLTEDDCLGRVPAPDKRARIAAHLLEHEADLKDSYGLNNGVPLGEAVKEISRDFKSFCLRVTVSDTSMERNFWPLAVCLGVVYLNFYNKVIAAKGEKVSFLTWEVWEKISNYRPDRDTPLFKSSPAN